MAEQTVVVRIPAEVHKAVKVQAAMNGKSISALVTEILKKAVEKKK